MNEHIKNLQKKVYDLEAQNMTLKEENALLRDFTYNIDSQAQMVHQHKFMNVNKENQQEVNSVFILKLKQFIQGKGVNQKLAQYLEIEGEQLY